VLLSYQDYPELLNLDVKNWSLDRRPWDPSTHRRWLSIFHLEMGALRPPVVTFAERTRSQWGLGLSPRLSPLWGFPEEVPHLSTMVASSGHRPLWGGHSLRAAMRSCCPLSFSFFLVRSWLQYTDMASCISWSSDFSPSATDFWSFNGYLGLTELEIIFEENLSHL
jgi:hypothetical protein